MVLFKVKSGKHQSQFASSGGNHDCLNKKKIKAIPSTVIEMFQWQHHPPFCHPTTVIKPDDKPRDIGIIWVHIAVLYLLLHLLVGETVGN